jgi:hypothetical protein
MHLCSATVMHLLSAVDSHRLVDRLRLSTGPAGALRGILDEAQLGTSPRAGLQLGKSVDPLTDAGQVDH